MDSVGTLECCTCRLTHCCHSLQQSQPTFGPDWSLHQSLEKDDRVKGYHRIERSYGAFARSFTLPDTVDAEGVRADYAHGVLTITLPKKAVTKARAIKVNVN